KLEFESVPEFVREPRSKVRDSYAANIATTSVTTSAGKAAVRPSTVDAVVPSAAAPKQNPVVSSPKQNPVVTLEEPDTDTTPSIEKTSSTLPKSAELETLWPGVSHDFLHATPNKGPSFYLVVGFIAGALSSMAAICGFAYFNHMVTTTSVQPGKQIVV